MKPAVVEKIMKIPLKPFPVVLFDLSGRDGGEGQFVVHTNRNSVGGAKFNICRDIGLKGGVSAAVGRGPCPVYPEDAVMGGAADPEYDSLALPFF